uniref:YadA-like family protein n=1 Tax=Acidaminococcus timonensis TaxID=1871002 RepID=UPI0025ECEBE0
ELDKDLEARSMQVGYGENGNNIQGQLLLYGPNSDNTYSNLIVESQYMDGKPYLTNTTSTGDKRLVYKDGTDDAIHTVATMSDGLKFSGDSGSTAAVTLGSTLAVTGGAAQDKLAKDTNNNLITGNIGVVAAENANGTSGSLTLALARDINLGSQGSLTADSTKVGYQTATTKISQTNETGNYVTGLTNTNWTGTDYVSGRAATEDQLYKVSQSVQDTVNAATFSITAGGQGEATDATITKNVGQSIRIFGDAPKVSGGGDGDGWDRSKANILTKVKKDNNGDEYISVELQDHLEVGTHAGTDTDGTSVAGVDGSMQFKGASAKEVNITGDTGIALSDNGYQTAALHQDNGAGYLDLTGTTAGTKASVSVHTGAKNLAQQDQTRLAYTDQSDKSHDVATMDDGLVVAGDNGQVTRLLNSTLKLSGGETDTTKLSSGQNIGVVANKDNNGFDIRLAKNLTGIESITGLTNTTIGPDFATQGRAATEEQLKLMQSSITQSAQGGGFGLTADGDGTKAAKADLGSTIGIHGDSNITTAVSEDGKSIDIKLNNQVNLGTDGSLKAGGVTISNQGIDAGRKNITNVASGIVNGDDSDNTNAANIGDVKTLAGEAAKTEIGKLGSRDFAGDDGETVSRGLGESMKLSGGADTSKLTNGNIGVVKNADGDGLDIRLSSELTGLTSVTTGNSTLNSDGLTVNNSDGQAGTTITSSGIKIAAGGEGTHAVEVSNSNVSMGGQQIHDVAPGTQPTDAVNVSQLGGVVSGVNNAITRLDSRVDRVGAGASALAALHPLEFDPEDKLNFAAGFGHYRSANAAAIGAFYQPTESVRFNVGGSFGGGENMVNAGVTFSLDPKRRDRFQSRIVLMRTVQQLRSDNEALRQDNQKVHAQLDAVNDRLNQLTALVEQLRTRG